MARRGPWRVWVWTAAASAGVLAGNVTGQGVGATDETLMVGPPTGGGAAPATVILEPADQTRREVLAGSAGGADDRPLGVPRASAERGGVAAPSAALGGGDELGTTLAALAGVVGLIVVVGFGYRALRPVSASALATTRAPSGILEILGRYPLPGGPTLILMRAGRRVLLLSQARASRLGGAAMTTLAEFEDAEDVASMLAHARDARDESISAKFQTLLSAFGAEHRTAGGERPRAGVVQVERIELTPETEFGGAGAGEVRGGRDFGTAGLDRSEEGAEAEGAEVTVVRRRAGASELRRRLEAMRAWEGAGP